MQCIIIKGDTMGRIAVQYGVPLTDLIAANPQIKDPNTITIDQVVNILVKASEPMSENMAKTPAITSGKEYEAYMINDKTMVEMQSLGCVMDCQGSIAKGSIIIPPKPIVVEVIKEVPDKETIEKVRRVFQAVKDLESI
jgi:hypothetical protein